MRLDLAPVLAPLQASYQRLSARERMLLGGALAAMVVIGFYVLVWQPLEDSQLALARRIQLKQRELVEMQHMRDEYLDLLTQFELRQKIIERADPKFSLFPHIEATVAQVLGGREKIASMNPQNKDLSGAYREESVELKLNQVSLQQLVDLMYHIEKSAQPLRLTRLQVKKRPREPREFDVTATVAMLKATGASRAGERAAPPPEETAPEVEEPPAAVPPDGETAPAAAEHVPAAAEPAPPAHEVPVGASGVIPPALSNGPIPRPPDAVAPRLAPAAPPAGPHTAEPNAVDPNAVPEMGAPPGGEEAPAADAAPPPDGFQGEGGPNTQLPPNQARGRGAMGAGAPAAGPAMQPGQAYPGVRPKGGHGVAGGNG